MTSDSGEDTLKYKMEMEFNNDEEGSGGSALQRKPIFQRLLPEQVRLLKDEFDESSKLTQIRADRISAKTKLSARQVEVWFQNERAKLKLKKTKNDLTKLRKTHSEQKTVIADLQQTNVKLKQLLADLQHQPPRTTPPPPPPPVPAPGFNRPPPPLSVANGTADLVIIKSDGRFLKASEMLKNVLGYPESDHPHLTIHSLTYPEDQTSMVLDQVLSGMVLEVLLRIRLRARSGEDVWTQMKAYSLGTSQGDLFMVAYISHIQSCLSFRGPTGSGGTF
mmetsp:Transcript_8882/g.15109  ORF Transcript_8882/g.15109 Transcript_8882/m.15109 type:complete len:277 (-) Transcript_8882:302-1132(-)